MSRYTTEVRYICEEYAGKKDSVGYNDIDSVIEAARPKVFDFSYPIYDESYKAVLETKILRHYYTREIGLETVGLWKHFLNMKMNEIMPYYNELYKSTLLEFNPFYDVDLTTDSKRGIDGNENSTDTRTGEKTGTGTSTDTGTGKKTDSVTDNVSTSDTGNETRNGTANETRTGTGTETKSGTSKQETEGSTLDKSDGTTKGNVSANGTDTTSATHEGTDKGESQTINTVRNQYSDTPQGALTDVEDGTYLTSATIVNNNTNVQNEGSHSGSDNTTLTKENTEESTGSHSDTSTKTVHDVVNGQSSDTTEISDKDVIEKTDKDTVESTKTGTSERTANGTTNNEYSNTRNTSDTETRKDTGSGTKEYKSTDEYLEHVRGKRGGDSYAKLLKEYRDTFVNIDVMIIKELRNLFFNLW